jgi:hypothetical protein
MSILFLSLFWWHTNLGKHHYPAGVQYAFMQEVQERGGTKKEAKCWLKAIEDTWTFNQAVHQYFYFLEHDKLTDEGWKVYIGCLPVKS